jgi:ferredoxin
VKINRVCAAYFSPTGATRRVALAVAAGAGKPVEDLDLTGRASRQASNHAFARDQLVVVGLPVYAGRLPLKIDDFFSGLKGEATPAVALVVYGNRNYDDALLELKIRLEERGFEVKAAGAFIGQHTFSDKIASGRPDANDLTIASEFGKKALLAASEAQPGRLELKGSYPFVSKGYDPSNPGGRPSFFRIETTDLCSACGLCAEECPWGAIDPANPRVLDSTRCMRCLRCVKNCPASAKRIADEKFLAFLPEFEAKLNARRCEPELYSLQ